MFVQVIKTTPSTHLDFAKTMFPIFSFSCQGILDWGLLISSLLDLAVSEQKAKSGPREPCTLVE